MPTPTRRTPGADQAEFIPSMADYQRAINQGLHWPHYNEDHQLQPFPISEMPPARAVNALHKVDRWRRSLFDEATEAIYDQAAATLNASPLVGALIEQALGPFYAGTYLKTATAVPHIDEIVQAGEAGALEVGSKARMKEKLLLIAIDALDENLGTDDRTFSQKCLALRDRLYDYLHGKD
jgi:hypothetical protein